MSTSELGCSVSLRGKRPFIGTSSRLSALTQGGQHGGTSPATVNRRLAILRRGYRLGKLRLDPARLDFTDLFLREASPCARYLTGDVFEAIHRHLPTTELREFFEFAYLFGTRKQQLARTTWTHLDAEGWVLTWQATDTKQNEPHVLPLAGRPLDIIQTASSTGAVRTARTSSTDRGAGPCQAVEGVRLPRRLQARVGDRVREGRVSHRPQAGGYVFHNTRHSAVTNLVNAGTPAHEAMAVSGHRTRSVG